MQYTRNTTMTKTDRDTLRSLHGRKKWEHIWAYYKLPIAIVLIVVYILGYAAYRHVTKKEDVPRSFTASKRPVNELPL